MRNTILSLIRFQLHYALLFFETTTKHENFEYNIELQD